MFTFVLKRLGLVVPTFLGITLLVFALIRLMPGDPVEALSGERGMTEERYQRLIHEFGLDRPLPVQYGEYVWKALHGDLGLSTITHEPVFSRVHGALPGDGRAVAGARCCSRSSLGLPAGIVAAVKRNTVWDYSVMGASLTGYSMPIFWWGLLLILTFSVGLGWTPVSGRIAIQYDIPPVTGFMLIDSLLSGDKGAFRSALSHLILPAIALGTIPLAVIARMTRSSMLEVLREDYVRTARAKGASTLARRRRPRPAQRPDPGGDDDRPAGRHAARRRDPHRDDLRLARHRQVAGRGDPPPRLRRRCRAAS